MHLSDRHEVNDEIEGKFDDWKNFPKEFKSDISILLVDNDRIIGYCDIYPVMKDAYDKLMRMTSCRLCSYFSLL